MTVFYHGNQLDHSDLLLAAPRLLNFALVNFWCVLFPHSPPATVLQVLTGFEAWSATQRPPFAPPFRRLALQSFLQINWVSSPFDSGYVLCLYVSNLTFL